MTDGAGQDRRRDTGGVGSVGAGGGVQRQGQADERGLARKSQPSPQQARLRAALSARPIRPAPLGSCKQRWDGFKHSILKNIKLEDNTVDNGRFSLVIR